MLPATRISSHESLAIPTHGTTATEVSTVRAAHGIAHVHDENINIVLLVLKIVKIVKYSYDLIIYSINTRNELAIFD